MKKILIGENHSDPIARELILELVNKIIPRKIQFMIEFEPDDYQGFVQDVKNNKLKHPHFKPLSEIINKAQLSTNIAITPIDVPWKLLLEGIQNMLKNKKANTSDAILNKVLEESWEDTYSLDDAVKFFIPGFSDNKDFKSLSDLLISKKLNEILPKLNGDVREEFYNKKSVKILRDNYFKSKINLGTKNDIEFLIILVGDIHIPSLDNIMRNEKNYHCINIPTKNSAKCFLDKVFPVEVKEIKVAPATSAPNSAFYQIALKDMGDPSENETETLSFTLNNQANP